MKYRVRANTRFQDGNIIPREILKGEELEVDENTLKRLQQSDPDCFEMLEKIVPPSTRGKSKPKEEAKDAESKEPTPKKPAAGKPTAPKRPARRKSPKPTDG
jgi:hypothetical protein